MSLTSFSRPLLSTFYFLLFTLLTFTPLRAESTAYFRTTDSRERSTERLYEFLEDIGYTVERDSEEASEIYVYQQSQKLALEVRTHKDDLTSIIAHVRYRFNPKAGTPESRALAANKFNDEQGGLKVCVDEEAGGMYFEFMLQFDNYLRPRLAKSFIDRIIITSHHFVFSDSDFKQTFFGGENSPDSATNADEVESNDDNDSDESMTDNEGNDATTPAVEEVSTPANTASPASPASPATPANPSSSTQQSPSSAAQPPSRSADQPSSPPVPPESSSTQPPSSTAIPPSSSPSAPAVSQPTAPTANPTPTTSPSLETALPPTTPAAPARTKKARA